MCDKHGLLKAKSYRIFTASCLRVNESQWSTYTRTWHQHIAQMDLLRYSRQTYTFNAMCIVVGCLLRDFDSHKANIVSKFQVIWTLLPNTIQLIEHYLTDWRLRKQTVGYQDGFTVPLMMLLKVHGTVSRKFVWQVKMYWNNNIHIFVVVLLWNVSISKLISLQRIGI